jgi:hypothetical protein
MGIVAHGRALLEDRRNRIERKCVFDVHQDELLVLLFMMQPKLDEASDLVGGTSFKETSHRGVDSVAKLCHFLTAWARDQTAQ